MSTAELHLSPANLPPSHAGRGRGTLAVAAWVLAAALPLVGFASLLLREQLDPDWSNHRVHFTAFLAVGVAVFVLAYAAGGAANRRGDARVLLISLAFLATGGFLGLHALGTAGVLVTQEHAGFKVANPVGLVLAALFALASAFVDLRPSFAPLVVRHRAALQRAVLVAMAVWLVWTVTDLPPLRKPGSEGGSHSVLAVMAGAGAVVYAVAAARYWYVYRGRIGLLQASVIACWVLLAEAMIGVAVTGERAWHASWWEWHGLIVTAYAVVSYAAHRQWRDERFRSLYLPTTRERVQPVSVLFSDLAGFTAFAERAKPAEVATVLNTYYAVAAPLIARRFGGEVEKFMGDGMMATFNSRGDEPDHAVRAAGAALALQREVTALAEANPAWPRLRVGVNTGVAVVREMGGDGFVAYEVVGDTVNTASRLETEAPVGGVLIGAETRRALPGGSVVEAVPGLRVKGKRDPVDAYLL
ncbi:MAG TPA: adenylate/guanylate cyclase domain-containing protein, partial [Solirubrobacteraceae bacterium]|nr:adenylate/guanylate cyclase domain-containing protein [Solirubrobacteraceae bacterium]